jgi:hypothetical protein
MSHGRAAAAHRREITMWGHVARLCCWWMCAAGAYLGVCCAVAMLPRNRAADSASAVSFDLQHGVEWQTGRRRVLEQWVKVIPVLEREPYLLDMRSVDGVAPLRWRASPNAKPASCPSWVIAAAGWRTQRRDYRRVLGWGWPLPIVGCSLVLGEHGYEVLGGIAGRGLAPEWIADDKEFYYPARSSPNGGVLPYQVFAWPLLWESLVLAVVARTIATGVLHIRRRYRHAHGACSRCGYPMHGGVCPECGAVTRGLGPARGGTPHVP